jgi:transposase
VPKGYRSYLPEQDLLLPPSLRDWLPENHLAYFVSDVVDQLDLTSIHAVYEKHLRGQPPYDPRMMTKLPVYGYCVGVYSARKIQQRLSEDVGFRVLAAGNAPDFRTISDFRIKRLRCGLAAVASGRIFKVFGVMDSYARWCRPT